MLASARRAVSGPASGIAPSGEMFAGQALYLEWRSDDVLDGYLIPEQDLEFL